MRNPKKGKKKKPEVRKGTVGSDAACGQCIIRNTPIPPALPWRCAHALHAHQTVCGRCHACLASARQARKPIRWWLRGQHHAAVTQMRQWNSGSSPHSPTQGAPSSNNGSAQSSKQPPCFISGTEACSSWMKDDCCMCNVCVVSPRACVHVGAGCRWRWSQLISSS